MIIQDLTPKYFELEYENPKLSMRRFDLFFKDKHDENVVFEFKYIKNGSTRNTDEKQRVFNDLMRLYLYLEEKHRGYFLICGDQFEFIPNFQRFLLKDANATYITPVTQPNQPVQSEGFYTEWFSFGSNISKLVNLKTDKPEYRLIYDGFVSEYSDSYLKKTGAILQLPASITTKLIFLSEDIQQLNGLIQPAKIGIWEVTQTT